MVRRLTSSWPMLIPAPRAFHVSFIFLITSVTVSITHTISGHVSAPIPRNIPRWSSMPIPRFAPLPPMAFPRTRSMAPIIIPSVVSKAVAITFVSRVSQRSPSVLSVASVMTSTAGPLPIVSGLIGVSFPNRRAIGALCTFRRRFCHIDRSR